MTTTSTETPSAHAPTEPAVVPPSSAHHAPQATAAPQQQQATAVSQDHGRIPTTDLLRRQMAHCGEYSFQALNKIGKLSPEDTGRITQQYLKYLNEVAKGTPFIDSLEFLYFEGWRKPELEARDTILKLTRSLISYSKTKITHLAFAHQTDTPIEFYNSFPAISEISRLLNVPIIQVSEKDFFSVASINPFTATAAARLISNEIQHEIGRKPFSFVSTTDLTAWKYLIGRHFGA
ncbi:MAG: hypothetical protein GXX91_14395 [Verrucomicrobiaceae bacterium]|nr:hypothetical protein [Verrucomicrobiaceae bacterium]